MTEFSLRIYEADDIFYEGPCVSLVVPTTEGMYGIWANHLNTIAAVSIGEMKFTLPDGTVYVASVSEGMVKIENNDVLVLVDAAEYLDEIDENRARKALEAAEEALLQEEGTRNYRLALAMKARAMNRLRVKKRLDP